MKENSMLINHVNVNRIKWQFVLSDCFCYRMRFLLLSKRWLFILLHLTADLTLCKSGRGKKKKSDKEKLREESVYEKVSEEKHYHRVSQLVAGGL